MNKKMLSKYKALPFYTIYYLLIVISAIHGLFLGSYPLTILECLSIVDFWLFGDFDFLITILDTTLFKCFNLDFELLDTNKLL